MMIENSTPVDETPFGAFGTFDGYDQTADWTDEDWAEYDRYVAEEMDKWDEDHADDYVDLDPEPPF